MCQGLWAEISCGMGGREEFCTTVSYAKGYLGTAVDSPSRGGTNESHSAPWDVNKSSLHQDTCKMSLLCPKLLQFSQIGLESSNDLFKTLRMF